MSARDEKGRAEDHDGNALAARLVEAVTEACFSDGMVSTEPADALIAHMAAREAEVQELVKALREIRDMDYRGNRHSSADIAARALDRYADTEDTDGQETSHCRCRSARRSAALPGLGHRGPGEVSRILGAGV